MTPQEARAAVRLAGRTVAGVTSHVQRVHQAVAARPFRLTSPAAAPVRLVHDAVAGGVYATVRVSGLAAGALAGELLAATRPEDSVPAGSTPAGNLALAALNAAVGHRLAEEGDPLAIRMAVRDGGRDVALDRTALAAAFPTATVRLAVFVHGLGGTEDPWRLHARRYYQDPRVCYGTRLADDFGYTPVYLRYNTGLHVSENGRLLAGLLEEVVANWPTTVKEILLVGHSTGGLVARSACHQGQQAGAAWVPCVRHVVCLGAPHLGAPLERGAALLGVALGAVAETRPFAMLVNGRSAGIKDLRYGYLLEEEWGGCDPDSCLDDHRGDVPLLGTANHYVVAATVTRDPGHPLGRVVGDLLVLPASAHGRHRRGRHIPFPLEARRQLGPLHHFHLLNHPAVYEAIRAWLDPSPAANAAGDRRQTSSV
jgi:PGAP1-like protein